MNAKASNCDIIFREKIEKENVNNPKSKKKKKKLILLKS